VTVACVQVEPAILDRAGTLDLVAEHTAAAASAGAGLVVFPETFVRLDPEPQRTVVNRSDGDVTVLIVSAPRLSGYTPPDWA